MCAPVLFSAHPKPLALADTRSERLRAPLLLEGEPVGALAAAGSHCGGAPSTPTSRHCGSHHPLQGIGKRWAWLALVAVVNGGGEERKELALSSVRHGCVGADPHVVSREEVHGREGGGRE